MHDPSNALYLTADMDESNMSKEQQNSLNNKIENKSAAPYLLQPIQLWFKNNFAGLALVFQEISPDWIVQM